MQRVTSKQPNQNLLAPAKKPLMKFKELFVASSTSWAVRLCGLRPITVFCIWEEKLDEVNKSALAGKPDGTLKAKKRYLVG